MTPPMLTLTLLEGELAVCQLVPTAGLPPWAQGGPLLSVTWTAQELTVVCPAHRVPEGVRKQAGWRVLRLEGPFPFTATGVLVAVAAPLAGAGIPLLAQSTFDTDYVLVQQAALPRALEVLRAAGHQVRGPEAAPRGPAGGGP